VYPSRFFSHCKGFVGRIYDPWGLAAGRQIFVAKCSASFTESKVLERGCCSELLRRAQQIDAAKIFSNLFSAAK
jgi:hypothetical protein